MRKIVLAVLLAGFSSFSMAMSFPHKTASYTSTMNGPMGMKVYTEAYTSFDGKNSVVAEWVTQKTPMGTTRTFNLNKGGFVFAVDMDKDKCTQTDISGVQNMVDDPEKMAEQMKQQMQLKENGTCEGAGLNGTKYSSPFGELCLYKDVFLVWMNAMGSKTVVDNVKFDIELPKDKTTLPAGMQCEQGPDLSKGLGGLIPNGQKGDGSNNTEPRGQQQPMNPQEALKGLEELLGQ